MVKLYIALNFLGAKVQLSDRNIVCTSKFKLAAQFQKHPLVLQNSIKQPGKYMLCAVKNMEQNIALDI